MTDQSKDVHPQNQGSQTGKPEKEGAFSHQSGKDIQQPQKKDVQSGEQKHDAEKTGTR